MAEGLGGYSEEVVRQEPKLLSQESQLSRYELALEHLQSFAESDVSSATTAVELTERVGIIAQDLDAVAIERGTVRQREDLQGLEFVLTTETEKSRTHLKAQGDRIVIEKYYDKDVKPQGHDRLLLELPMRPLDVTDESVHNLVSAFAINNRGGNMQMIMPLNNPQNSEVQRNFAVLLQESVRDIISTSPAVAEISP